MNNNNKINNKINNMIKKEEVQVIPDQLNILIRTSVPGFQLIEYKPSMTIEGSDSKGVQFNPLIRLNKSIINKIPPEYIKKQFFNKGLFQSLLNYTGEIPAKSLFQATQSGYVDNNIKVTLDTIFPVNSVIYIDKNPYAIGDIQWTTGDWKVDLKQKKEETRTYKIREFVSSEGEKQLKQFPKSLSVGKNYSEPVSNIEKPIPTSSNIEKPIPTSSNIEKPTIAPKPNATTELSVVPKVKLNTQEIEPLPYSIPKKQLSLAPQIEEDTTEEERLFEIVKDKYKLSLKSLKKFKNYFLEQSYYNIVNEIYLGFSNNIKKLITNFYKFTTSHKKEVNEVNLSRTMYTSSCNQVKIYSSPGDGDCFFVAVASGINLYNYENQDKKFYYQNYGKSKLYTVTFLRDIVLKYYEGLDEQKKQDLRIIGTANVNNLNEKFKNSIQEFPIKTDTDYMERLDIIYKSEDNFLVYKPERRPFILDDELKPFKLVTENQIANYIRSKNYWGDQFAIQAICNILKIYIIPIDSFERPPNNKLLARPVEPDTIKNICSKNIMFLYRENLHYELISFNYKQQKLSKSDVIKRITFDKNFTIFKSGNIPPPFQILVLIYGSNYVLLENNLKENYGIYSEYMKTINASVMKSLTDQTFANLFTEKFMLNKPLTYYIQTDEIEEENNSRIIGGEPYPQKPQFITKKSEGSGEPKLAYRITIDMELHPGKSLTPEQIHESKCNAKYNSIRKAFSELSGRPYIIPPVFKTKKNIGGRKRVTRKTHLYI